MLGADIIEGFKKAGIPRLYHADEPIVLENEPSTGMYLILRGDAKVVRRTSTGATEEITSIGGCRLAPENVKVFNPAFDVTPHRYVTAIISEKGIARSPYEETFEVWAGEKTSQPQGGSS